MGHNECRELAFEATEMEFLRQINKFRRAPDRSEQTVEPAAATIDLGQASRAQFPGGIESRFRLSLGKECRKGQLPGGRVSLEIECPEQRCGIGSGQCRLGDPGRTLRCPTAPKKPGRDIGGKMLGCRKPRCPGQVSSDSQSFDLPTIPCFGPGGEFRP